MAHPPNPSIRDLVLDHVTRVLNGPAYPEKSFVDGYTFADVYRMAENLKSAWSGLPLKNTIIGLFTENKAAIAASVLAALSTGYILVMPHGFSRQAYEQIRETLDIGAAVADSAEDLPGGVVHVNPECSPRSAPYSKSKFSIDIDRDIVIFYTGGSTGKPKEWLKSVLNIFAESVTLSMKFGVRPDDRFLSTVPPNHIYGFLFSVLTPFAASCSVSADTCTFPHTIASEIGSRSTTILVSVPMHYRVLNGYTLPPSGLRLAFSSAGLLDRDDGLAFSRQTGVPVVEVYGSTETGGIATRSRRDGEDAFTPFDTVDWRIEGDMLFVRSANIARSVETDGDGFFLIGDRVAPCSDGSFLVLGRSDGIVKVGGKRVDLDGICELIKQTPGVEDAVVMSFPAAPGRENTIAALIAGPVDRMEILTALSGSVEGHAMPRIIRIVDAIPATASGKYDRPAIEHLLKTEQDDVRATS
jgi:acyl-coenzyme A synthetase/AMP-(fatty) acid ligase